MENNMTMLILSCDKFSDLWDGHVKLLEKNWANRGMPTYIVTDKPTNKQYDSVKIIAVGEGVEWSSRLRFALDTINTEYVFITLDDYFLIEPVDNNKISYLINFIENENYDYIRLFKRPVRATKEIINGYKGIRRVDTNTKYSVNLYTAIWRRRFLCEMTKDAFNAWEFEVHMPAKSTEYGAKCAVSSNNEFEILDVVRKGKFLHKSAKYLKKHPDLYSGTREVNTWRYEIGLGIKTFVARHTPKPIHNAIKSIMKKFGYKFISE